MLTGSGSEEIAVQALHKGAIDYIPKDSFSKDSIWGLIKAALETWKRKRAEEGLRRKNDDCGVNIKRTHSADKNLINKYRILNSSCVFG